MYRDLHTDPLPRRPGMRMLGNIKDAFGHLPVLAYPDDPFEMTFKNLDRVIIHGDRFRNLSKHDKS